MNCQLQKQLGQVCGTGDTETTNYIAIADTIFF